MSTCTYEIRHHPNLSWWDGRHGVYVVGRYCTGLIGRASTKWGARRLIKDILACEGASQAYTLVEVVRAPALSGEER
ncbi:hypothetical protein ACFWYW_04040 [Nonomuraea sp. NPDC059023]|uniref:hypothetical protein n=1 Tax=unclassified Nonomuraea TaxID=2593643 RepID=UPI0036928FF9